MWLPLQSCHILIRPNRRSRICVVSRSSVATKRVLVAVAIQLSPSPTTGPQKPDSEVIHKFESVPSASLQRLVQLLFKFANDQWRRGGEDYSAGADVHAGARPDERDARGICEPLFVHIKLLNSDLKF